MEKEFEFRDEDFSFIKDLVHKKSGIQLSDRKKNLVYSRITRRLRALKFTRFRDYCEYLAGDNNNGELVDFINAITTNLTKFFRENHHFEHLREVAIPAAIGANKANKRLRLWSAGCSVGMEPYSIAMVLAEFMDELRGWDVKILATDIDTKCLDHAQKGIYSQKDVETVPSNLRKYYKQINDSDHVVMSDKLKSLISFKKLNLIEAWPVRGSFDVIFCRNVVIYFNKETQRVLFKKFHNHLSDTGYLYIGHSENLNSVSNDFRLKSRTTYTKN